MTGMATGLCNHGIVRLRRERRRPHCDPSPARGNGSRLIGNLGKQIEGGDLALLAAVNGALAAIDMDGGDSVVVAPGARAILADDGQTITLTIYTQAAVATGAALTGERAIALAGELIAAGLRPLRRRAPRLIDGGNCEGRPTMTDLSAHDEKPDFWQALHDVAYALDEGDVLALDAIDALRQAYPRPPVDDKVASVLHLLTMMDIELRRRVLATSSSTRPQCGMTSPGFSGALPPTSATAAPMLSCRAGSLICIATPPSHTMPLRPGSECRLDRQPNDHRSRKPRGMSDDDRLPFRRLAPTLSRAVSR
jgi:hypothetical protein